MMIVKLLNGEIQNINLKSYKIDKGYIKSKFQKSIKDELIKKYPYDIIFEEVYIPGEKFYLDFLIPSLSIAVEVHGIQHTKHVKFFHKTKRDFHKQKDVDERKRNWCKLNNLKLIEIYE